MSQPKQVADLLKGVLREARTAAKRSDVTEALIEVLGTETSKHCHVTGFRSGQLVVEVDSAPLFSELSSFRREEIRLALNENLKKEKVARLTFRMGGTGHV